MSLVIAATSQASRIRLHSESTNAVLPEPTGPPIPTRRGPVCDLTIGTAPGDVFSAVWVRRGRPSYFAFHVTGRPSQSREPPRRDLRAGHQEPNGRHDER